MNYFPGSLPSLIYLQSFNADEGSYEGQNPPSPRLRIESSFAKASEDNTKTPHEAGLGILIGRVCIKMINYTMNQAPRCNESCRWANPKGWRCLYA
jgi:hypothetical protein